MALIKYRYPISLVNDFQDEVNRFFNQGFLRHDQDLSKVDTSHWVPHVDIKDEVDRLVFLADIPGVKPKDIKVNYEDGMLTVQGERHSEVNETEKDYVRIERSSGVFYRRFSLPDNVDADRISATGKDGVLEIVIPKTSKGKPLQINVN